LKQNLKIFENFVPQIPEKYVSAVIMNPRLDREKSETVPLKCVLEMRLKYA
jgi:hypothetical protein